MAAQELMCHKNPRACQEGIVSLIQVWSRLRNSNALRRKGMKACPSFRYPDKMGFFLNAGKNIPSKPLFTPRQIHINNNNYEQMQKLCNTCNINAVRP
jgi:hypothetical protein